MTKKTERILSEMIQMCNNIEVVERCFYLNEKTKKDMNIPDVYNGIIVLCSPLIEDGKIHLTDEPFICKLP